MSIMTYCFKQAITIYTGEVLLRSGRDRQLIRAAPLVG